LKSFELDAGNRLKYKDETDTQDSDVQYYRSMKERK